MHFFSNRASHIKLSITAQKTFSMFSSRIIQLANLPITQTAGNGWCAHPKRITYAPKIWSTTMERSDEIIRECAPRVEDPVHGRAGRATPEPISAFSDTPLQLSISEGSEVTLLGLCQIDFGKFGRRPRTNRTEGEGDNVRSVRSRAHGAAPWLGLSSTDDRRHAR